MTRTVLRLIEVREQADDGKPPLRASTRAGTEFRRAFLEAALLRGNLTQHQLARVLTVSDNFVSHIVSGRRLPTSSHIELLAAATRLPEETRKELHRLGASADGWDVSA